MEWKEKLAETKEAQEKRLSVARERLRMGVESINAEFQASVDQIQEELKVLTSQIVLI